jgi:hypothetical protein
MFRAHSLRFLLSITFTTPSSILHRSSYVLNVVAGDKMVPFAWLLPLFRSELLSLEAEYVAVGNEYFNEWIFCVTRTYFIDLNAVRQLQPACRI